MINFIRLSSNAKFVIAAEFEKRVHVFNFKEKLKLYTIKTLFGSSRERYNISNDETTFVTSNWKNKSIILHELANGSVIWKNNEINHIHSIDYSQDDKLLYVRQDEFFFIIDHSNGKIIDKISDYQKRFDDFNSDMYMVVKKNNYHIYSANQVINDILMPAFSILDACFYKNSILVSEVGGKVKCLNVINSENLWTYTPEKGKHFLRLVINFEKKVLFGIEYSFEKILDNRLFIFNLDNGEIIDIIDLETRFNDHSFDKFGRYLVTTDGDIYTLYENKIKKEKNAIVFD